MSWCSLSACARATSSARAADLDVHPRGGVLIDAGCQTSDPRILAVGEVANFDSSVRRARRARVCNGRGRGDAATRRRGVVPRLRPLDQAQALGRRRRELRGRLRDHPRRARRRLLRPGRGRLQEARALGRREDAARRHPRRRRLRLWIAPPAHRWRPRRRPGRVPHARGRRRRAHRRAARRGAGLLVQQRHGRVDPPRRARGWLHGCRGHQVLHQGRSRLRVVRDDGQEDRRDRAREIRSGAQQRAVRALRHVTTSAVRRRPRVGAHDLQRGDRAVRHRPRLRHLQARTREHPLDARRHARARGRERDAAGHQRPRDGQPPEGRQLLGRPTDPRRRDHARGAAGDRAGRPGLRAVHQDHRRAADRHVRRATRAAARHLEATRRGRLRVRSRVRQVAADGEVVRRLDLVPLRRPGLRRHGGGAGAALPRPAVAPQAQARRLGVRARMRRSPRQGRRRHRDRSRLEHVRRRQRRLHPASRRAARRGLERLRAARQRSTGS